MATTSRRYQALASASVAGLVPSAAAASAGAMPAASRLRPSRARSTARARIGVGRHGAVGDARAGDAPARHRQMRGDAEHRHALGLHAGHLAEAERVGAGRARHRHRHHEAAAAGPVAAGQELLQRRLLRATVGALHHHRGVQRQQRGGEIAVGRGREQVAADGRHGAHRGAADHARHRMQEGQIAAGEDVDHAHAGADDDARALVADLAIGWDRWRAPACRSSCRPR